MGLYSTLLYFASTEEDHLLNMCWIAAMMLHLLLSSSNGAAPVNQRDSAIAQEVDGIEYRHSALLHYVWQVLRSSTVDSCCRILEPCHSSSYRH